MGEAAGHLLQGRRSIVSITRAGGKQARYAAHVRPSPCVFPEPTST